MILKRENISSYLEKLRKEGKKIGYTSGVFDLLHPGHIDSLNRAKALCDILVVGVNSDESVRSYKGELRPIQDSHSRASIVDAIGIVDFVFVFDERRNEENIRVIKPDVYIKAGDYDKSQLTSAPIVESYGGKVEIVPLLAGYSSSSIIETICTRYLSQYPLTINLPKQEPRPALFIDRDGTINEEIEYLSDPKDFRLYPRVMAALKKAQDAGFKIVIVTNQAGIGLGYFSKEDFYKVNKEMLKAASKAGVLIDRVYYSPHGKAEKSSCRKPEPGMLIRGINELNLIAEQSFMIGDKTADIEAGRRAGVKTILVKTGHAGKDGECQVSPDFTADTLYDAVKIATALRE